MNHKLYQFYTKVKIIIEFEDSNIEFLFQFSRVNETSIMKALLHYIDGGHGPFINM